MNRSLPLLAVISICTAVGLVAEPPRLARNPIIWADVPDMAMMRVGDTYYMSSTTMHLSPGLPIMKSKDLVNWFNYATKAAGGFVDFDYFGVSDQITATK